MERRSKTVRGTRARVALAAWWPLLQLLEMSVFLDAAFEARPDCARTTEATLGVRAGRAAPKMFGMHGPLETCFFGPACSVRLL